MTHGTAYAYKSGCRCDECRARSAETRRNHRAGLGPGKTPRGQQSHGAWAYKYHRCRCDICRAANTQQMRDYVARKRARA